MQIEIIISIILIIVSVISSVVSGISVYYCIQQAKVIETYRLPNIPYNAYTERLEAISGVIHEMARELDDLGPKLLLSPQYSQSPNYKEIYKEIYNV